MPDSPERPTDLPKPANSGAFARTCLTIGLASCAAVVVFAAAAVPWYFSIPPARQFRWFWPFLWIMIGLSCAALCGALPALLGTRTEGQRVPSGALFGFVFGLTSLVFFSPAVFVLLSVLGTSGAHIRRDVEQSTHDLGTLLSSIEEYRTDQGAYPPWTADPQRQAMFVSEKRLPSFEASAPDDSLSFFSMFYASPGYPQDPYAPRDGTRSTYAYWVSEGSEGFILLGRGPDGVFDVDFETLRRAYEPTRFAQEQTGLLAFTYDPTNGLVSAGDLWVSRVNPDVARSSPPPSTPHTAP
ncbi:hypothetical protein JW916_03685 [Candidatus Sumerlaeota bacterium]|nr:hypothetical protein [Candidatus Sumerlaeota bacterium]